MTIELYIYYPFCILKSSLNKGECASVYKILTYACTPSKDENLLLHVCVCHSSHSLKYSLSFNCTLNNYVIRPTYCIIIYQLFTLAVSMFVSWAVGWKCPCAKTCMYQNKVLQYVFYLLKKNTSDVTDST